MFPSSSLSSNKLTYPNDRTAVGLDPYLEASSSPLIIPKGYHLPEEEVRAVWSELLEVTDKKDWHEIFIKGETKFELTNGMVSFSYFLGGGKEKRRKY